MKKTPSKPKKRKSLIEAGVRIDPQYRHLVPGIADSLQEMAKPYGGMSRGDAIREAIKQLQQDTIVKKYYDDR
jgi:gamma-glutamyltranspeptidase